VMFQDGALFGSLNLYDNIAFPLREHTKKTEAEIRQVVLAKMEMVGLTGEEHKFPGEISGGMRKRAGLARALVLDPQIILCDEPDSGLDPVRTAYLSQLLIDLNAEIDATILIVTHDIMIARTVPDNIGMLFRGNLVMFGPREVLLTSDNPVITQFVNGRRIGPIGMSEEKDEATLAQERASLGNGAADPGSPALMPQLVPSPGLPERQAVHRRMDRVMSILPTLPTPAQQAILADIAGGPAQAQPPDPERDRAQAQARAEAWRLAREREAAQREAEQETAEQDKPGSWPPDWPGGGG
jgi:phospholipid/cholesterol/gamma-HCH transport system ATP-binding protein